MQHRLIRTPLGLIHVVDILREAGQVDNAKVRAACRPTVRSRLTDIIEARPDVLSTDKVVVLHMTHSTFVTVSYTHLIKKGAPLLPIDAAKYQNILVVGDNAVRLLNQGGGSSELKVKDMVSPLDGLRAVYGDKVAYAKGYAAGRPMYGRADEIPQNVVDSLRAEAVEMAKKADLVVLVGGLNKNHFQDCEGGDRLEYGLPCGQDELIEALLGVNKNLVPVSYTHLLTN